MSKFLKLETTLHLHLKNNKKLRFSDTVVCHVNQCKANQMDEKLGKINIKNICGQ